MKIKDIITQVPQSVSPDTTLVEAARDMKDMDIGILPVCEHEHLVGTVTDRDITIRAIADGRDPKTTKVGDVMSKTVLYCFEDQDVQEAAEKMKKGRVRRLPVLDQAEHLVGIISLGDLAVRAGDGAIAGKILEHVCAPAYAI
jgi:CBS domain-containing protein